MDLLVPLVLVMMDLKLNLELSKHSISTMNFPHALILEILNKHIQHLHFP